MNGVRGEGVPAEAIRGELGAEISRRGFLRGAGGLGLAALVAGALPTLEGFAAPAPASAQAGLTDGSLEAFFDTVLPGRKVNRTVSGKAITPGAILGLDPEPGAVEADALELANDSRLGFTLLAPVFLAELEVRALAAGGPFLSLGYGKRVEVCKGGLAFSNPTRLVWEAAAAVPFTAFCAAATVIEPTPDRAPGLAVMGHPGIAPRGYRNASYRRRLARGRTKGGSLP